MKDSVPRQNTHLKFWPFHKAILKMFVWNFLDPGGREGIFFFISGGYFTEVGDTSKQTLLLFWPELWL